MTLTETLNRLDALLAVAKSACSTEVSTEWENEMPCKWAFLDAVDAAYENGLIGEETRNNYICDYYMYMVPLREAMESKSAEASAPDLEAKPEAEEAQLVPVESIATASAKNIAALGAEITRSIVNECIFAASVEEDPDDLFICKDTLKECVKYALQGSLKKGDAKRLAREIADEVWEGLSKCP